MKRLTRAIVNVAAQRQRRPRVRAATAMKNKHYYLMDSVGRVYPIEYGLHDDWAYQLLTRLGIKEPASDSEEDSLDHLFKLGWRRIGIHAWIVDVWPQSVNKLQLAALKEWCALEPTCRAIEELEKMKR